jgi:hypothetical protein
MKNLLILWILPSLLWTNSQLKTEVLVLTAMLKTKGKETIRKVPAWIWPKIDLLDTLTNLLTNKWVHWSDCLSFCSISSLEIFSTTPFFFFDSIEASVLLEFSGIF